MQIKVRNDNIDKALRVFKKKTSEIVYEVKQRQHYDKPSTVRRKKLLAAKAREQKRREKHVQ